MKALQYVTIGQPPDVREVPTPLGGRNRGSRPELVEVLELARNGQLAVEIELYSLDQAPEAYRKLHDGELRGRAVVVP
ncbi:zinc-binding dehydrogenase [Nesterenkonia sandarakina]|uniref:D-arabinose 1-dehydrogenase-like Zn-dependent alcohol dehydrogenase n=1 Tax=Nesterenkonia sandarakina TaxID=272918 RepID=A0A7Z0EAK2_9MICC|nr:zinc-binding dehydrogenase [Nesterenkonia sandarakina]NYJ17650.1 D-arabinose 1-dehydrogenase-like Zn-dependent alcohol dehydrogenase [Nesterenkonia sandarakina]